MPTMLGTVASQRSVTAPTIPMTGLVGWYDADDAATFVYQGAPPNVLTWQDKSPNAKHMTAQYATPFRNGTQNGRPTVVFNGTNGYMECTGVLTTAVDNITMFAACKRTGGNPNESVVLHNGTPTSNGIGLALRSYTVPGNIGILRGGVAWHSTATADPAAPCVLSYTRAAGTSSMWLNDTATDLSTTAALTAPTAMARLASGTHLFGGEIYEALMYDRALDSTERQQVQSYLATKWGTPVSPVPMTGLVGWWDANDTASFTFFTSNQISRWSDKSGSGNHATPFNNDPTWYATRTASVINGLPAIDFHPGALQTPLLGNMKPFTFMLALKTGANTSMAFIGNHYGQAGTNGRIDWGNEGGILRLLRSNVALIGQATTAVTANSANVIGVSYGSDDVWAHYRNGAVVGTGTTAGTFAAGTNIALGASTAPNTGNYDGLFGEFLIYNRVLTTVERQQVELYLKTKWGTP